MNLPPCIAGEPLALAEALRRYEAEAVRGTLDTGRYRCAYAVWGEGPPLLCIPGMADQGRSFVLVNAHLAGHFRCISYDLPTGRGDGARLGRYAHADLVADALALLDHLGVRQSYVLGCSFGATVALAALRAQPGRLPRGILQGSFAHRPLAPAEVLLARLLRCCPGSMSRLPFRQALLRRTHQAPFAGRPPEVWDFLVSVWNSPPLAAVAHRALVLHQLDLRPGLADIRQPVLLVGGDTDPLVGRACEEELLQGLPNAGRVELGACGHNPLYTHPEELAGLIHRFLTPPACAP
jgi:pimeloyl-ACP methyl ester carboxylesterase